MTTPTNTPTSKCDPKNHLMQTIAGSEPQMIPDPLCPNCSKYALSREELDNMHTPTTDSKNSSEDWEERFIEAGFTNLLFERKIIDFIRRERELVAKEEYEHGRNDEGKACPEHWRLEEALLEERRKTVEFIREYAIDHYWDSLTDDKEIVLKHLEFLLQAALEPLQEASHNPE